MWGQTSGRWYNRTFPSPTHSCTHTDIHTSTQTPIMNVQKFLLHSSFFFYYSNISPFFTSSCVSLFLVPSNTSVIIFRRNVIIIVVIVIFGSCDRYTFLGSTPDGRSPWLVADGLRWIDEQHQRIDRGTDMAGVQERALADCPPFCTTPLSNLSVPRPYRPLVDLVRCLSRGQFTRVFDEVTLVVALFWGLLKRLGWWWVLSEFLVVSWIACFRVVQFFFWVLFFSPIFLSLLTNVHLVPFPCVCVWICALRSDWVCRQHRAFERLLCLCGCECACTSGKCGARFHYATFIEYNFLSHHVWSWNSVNHLFSISNI